jgi:hypothetical protein
LDTPYGIVFMLFALSIPVVAIIGGITAGIVKTLSRQKMLEQAQKERIVALERGIDPDKLPPLELPEGLRPKDGPTFEQREFRRSNVLMIWGMIIGGFGLALLVAMAMSGESEWPYMFMFVFVGVALMLGSRLGRPTREEIERSLTRERGSGGTP